MRYVTMRKKLALIVVIPFPNIFPAMPRKKYYNHAQNLFYFNSVYSIFTDYRIYLEIKKFAKNCNLFSQAEKSIKTKIQEKSANLVLQLYTMQITFRDNPSKFIPYASVSILIFFK